MNSSISVSSSDSSTTRTGKVARLPKAVRDRLNQQLRDNVPGKELVGWLNEMPQVQDMLLEQFHGRAITPQNLSEWKLGGYQDWLAHEERRDWARRLGDEAEDLQRDSGALPLLENIASMFEVALGQAVMRLLDKPVESLEDMRPLMELSRELAKHRRLALTAAKARAEQEEKRRKEANPSLVEQMLEARSEALKHLATDQKLIREQLMLMERLGPEGQAKFEKKLGNLVTRRLEKPEGPGFAKGEEEVMRELDGVEMGQAEEEASEDDPSESDRIGAVRGVLRQGFGLRGHGEGGGTD